MKDTKKIRILTTETFGLGRTNNSELPKEKVFNIAKITFHKILGKVIEKHKPKLDMCYLMKNFSFIKILRTRFGAMFRQPWTNSIFRILRMRMLKNLPLMKSKIPIEFLRGCKNFLHPYIRFFQVTCIGGVHPEPYLRQI